MARRALEGKVAIITGAARGLGRAGVELFVEEGAKVVIADLEAAAGEALAKTLGGAAIFHRTDVSVPDEVRALVGTAVSHFGGLHVMVNNAGISSAHHISLLDETFEEFDRVMRVNALGVMVGTQAAARHMAKHGGGSIINVSSIAGLHASFGVMSYRVAKAGVNQFSKSAAIDLGQYGIRVNCIAPGNVSTEMNAYTAPGISAETAAKWDAAREEVRMATQPLKRNTRPRDVAQAMLYFASDVSAQVTGIVMPVDGGISIGDPVNRLNEILHARKRILGD